MRREGLTVSVIENESDYRELLRTILDITPGIRCLGSFADVETALRILPMQTPDLLLLDLDLGERRLGGPEAIRALKEKLPRLEVVVLSVHGHADWIFPALEAGAVGYLTKPIAPAELARALEEARAGGSPMSPAVARRVLQTFHQRARQRRDLESLTQREGDVLRRIAEGSDVGEVATELDITVRTVQTHLRHIYEKLQVHSRSQAVARYYRETNTTGAQA